MEKQDTLPCVALPYLNRVLFYTDSRVDRDFYIWDLDRTTDLNQKQIAKKVGSSDSIVNHTLLMLYGIGSFEGIMDYFMMQFEVADILSEHGYEANFYAANIVNNLMRHHVRSREQLVNLSPDEFEELCNTHAMKRAGNVAIDILREYYEKLHTTTITTFLNENAKGIEYDGKKHRKEKCKRKNKQNRSAYVQG